MDDDDHHNNHDHNKNMKRLSSEEGDPEAQNSKLAQEFEETSDGAGGDNENGGNDEQLCGRAVGATGGDNSIPVTEGIDARASSAPQTLEVPVEHGLQLFESAQELKDQVASSKEEKPKSIADQTAPAQTQNLEETPNGTLSSELSPTSVTQFVSSLPSPAQTEQKLSPAEKRNISDVQTQEVDKKNSFDRKNLSVISVQKTPSPDGYNWRKYGQKQVKSPQGSRSYYRCTHADCYAKKIECSDDSNRVTEIVYKSHHSHDRPQKVNCTRGSRVASSVAPVNEIDSSVRPIRIIADSVPSTSSMDSVHEMGAIPDPKQKESSQPHDISENVVKQEHVDETEPRKRLKKTGSSHSESPSKAGKKPKFVVQAAGDVGISGDGYRWRKYGQKMVKGNPHPRNYYRCTSAGCPVRKHIERAKDNTNAAIITYKGVHDHDKPVPKKRQGPPSTPLVAAASPASINSNPVVKPENIQNQESATQWSADKEGGLKGPTLDCGAEKAVESTRTLLSIGFEIKPC